MNVFFSRLKFRLTAARLVAVSSLFIVLVFNYPFLNAVYDVIHPSDVAEWIFFISVPVLLTCLTIVFLSISGAIFFPRIVIGTHMLMSSLLFYGTFVFGALFDKSMVQNLFETNTGEALSYLNLSFIVFFIFLCLFPIFAVFNQELKGGVRAKLKSLIKLNVITLSVIVLILIALYKSYAAVGRNNKGITKYITPFAFYDAGFKYLRDTYLFPPLPFRIIDKSPTLASDSESKKRTLVVVVGETARAANFSLNGYQRSTNPQLQNRSVVSFSSVESCGTATAISVPCMFSRLDRNNYSSRVAASQDNVLDIIHRAGVDVTWIDNNSSCKGVCARIDTVKFEPSQSSPMCDGHFCLDEILLEKLRYAMSQSKDEDSVIILHMIGSHGPTYYQRYPEKYRRFEPECPQSDIQNCSEEQLLNTYDNTIVYTDFVLGKVIDELAEQTDRKTAMLYISDHGESLGENGLYLHGFPFALAPQEQTHVAMIYWDKAFSDPAYKQCVDSLASLPLSHDNVFDTLLGLAAVNTTAYQPEKDIFGHCTPDDDANDVL